MKKSIPLTIVAAAGAVSLLLSGCSAQSGESSGEAWTIPTEDPTATISFVGINDPVKQNINEIIAAFEDEHPTITVKYEYVPFNDLNTVVDSRVSNKQGSPDLFYVDQPRVAALAQRGYLEDLTPQFSTYNDLFFPAAVEADSYNDKIYAVPMGSSTTVLFYNKELLAAAGIPAPAPDERLTWEQIKEYGAKAQAAGAEYGLLLQQPDRYYQLQSMPEALGGGSGITGTDMLTPALDNKGWLEAMEFYQSLFADGVVPQGVNSEQTDAAFASGKAAFEVATTDLVGVLDGSSVDWGASLQPTFKGAEAYSGTGGFAVGMNPFSKNKEAAAIFLQWMLVDGADGVTGYAKYRPGGVLPPQRKALDFYLTQPDFTTPSGKEVAQVIKEQTDTALPRPATVGYLEFEEITGRMFSDISNGTDSATALKTAERELDTAWAKYKK
ncbi:sugar ABC transporter substrate-binding protein [Homoserinimonas sp. OAct 916]|uniref:sugar ABC transporter substrate-binding protein n=1 Tax=Homoserinimonas sp. OAct 916 TaxID=2211450 RepID=UPI000DBE3818|nr:sugar ABC transporter substrate-binding protein [Homoserinimonas sp. OAct 916]